MAGIDEGSLTHVRPTTHKTDPLTRPLLRSEGGPFGPGAMVDLGKVVPEGEPPEMEDHRFAPANARHVKDVGDERYLDLLDRIRHESLVDAFGTDLTEVRPGKLAIPATCGVRSLAVVSLGGSELVVDDWGKLFLEIDDGDTVAKLRVTDVRFYEKKRFKADVVQDVDRRLRGGTPAYAMLGLARAIGDADGGQVHWLQCNGICLADRAVSDIP